MIGNINSLQNVNQVINLEKQRHEREKTSVVKKLFDDEPEVPEDQSGPSAASVPPEEQLS
jgi:hypothetical protein